VRIPQIFGSDVLATDACGNLTAKFIFHAAIRKYQNEDSLEVTLIYQYGLYRICNWFCACGAYAYDV